MSEEIRFTNEIEVFYELKRRLKITRKARIMASKRLRKKHELYEKITHFYSILILVLSIWFIGDPSTTTNNIIITKVLLILSLSLTFFTMYLNIRNYKERASAFETNYQSLDILLNRMERLEVTSDKITDSMLKELHREYEKLLLEKENHHDVDYMNSNPELKDKYKFKLAYYTIIESLKNFGVTLYPVILLMLIFVANKIFKLFS